MYRGEISSLEAAEANLSEQKSLVEAAEQAIKDAYRKAHEAKENYEAAKFQVEAIKRKNHIEEIFWRFPHIGEQILDQLDDKSVPKFLEVSRWWQKFMDEAKVVKIRQIQKYISISNSAIRKRLLKQSWNKLKELTHLLHFLTFLLVRFENDPVTQKTKTNAMLFKLISDGGKDDYEAHCQINKEQCKGCSKYNENFLNEKSSLNYKEMSTFLIELIIDNIDDKNPELKIGNTLSSHMSLLHLAALNGNLEVCKIVTDNLQNKNPADNNGNTILHTAATYGRVEIYQFILEKVKKKDPTNKYGATPFHIAAEYGHLQVCLLIISNIDSRSIQNFEPLDNFKMTPLQVAKIQGHKKICELIKSAIEESNRKLRKRLRLN